MKGTTMMSGGGSTSGTQQGSFIVELLLFGQQAAQKRGVNMTQSSFNNTIGSSQGGYVSPVFALKYMLKNCPITTFEISVTNADGTRRSDSQMQDEQERIANNGKKKKNQIKAGGKSNAFKIQFLLD